MTTACFQFSLMRRFLLFFRQFQKLLANSNTCISVNIARKIKCYISKSKLIICEYNGFYFSEIALIGFTLHEIKEGIVFFGTPGILLLLLLKLYLKKVNLQGKMPVYIKLLLPYNKVFEFKLNSNVKKHHYMF